MKRLHTILVLALVGCSGETGGGGVDANGNHFPEILSFACDPMSGVAPVMATCTWQIRDLDEDKVSCAVDVGPDGNAEFMQDDCAVLGTEVKLTTIGEARLRLFLTDAKGNTATADTSVAIVAPPNKEPEILSFTADPVSGGQPLPVTLRFSVNDPDVDELFCKVFDGDQEIIGSTACAMNETRNITLSDIRAHVLKLEVVDSRQGKATREVTVTVNAQPQVGDLRVSKVEWGQTVVSENPRLVPGKDALLRVYVLSERAGIGNVNVKIVATAGSTALGELMLQGPATAPTTDQPASLATQWRGTIPGAWIQPVLKIVVTIDPNNALGETNKMNNVVTLQPVVGYGNILPVTNVPIVQAGRTGTVRNIVASMKQIWPLKDVNTITRAAYTYSGTVSSNGAGWDQLLDNLLQTRRNDNSRRDYLGWINVGFGGGVAGLGYVGIGAALTRDDTISTSLHELGHNMGREHAPCGGAGGADPQYPVAGARLDVQGYDNLSGSLISTTSAYDVMSYCDPNWVSNYNYRAVQTWLESHPVSASSPLVSAPRIVVNGRIKAGQLMLNPLTLIHGPIDTDIEPGDYTATLYGEQTVSLSFGASKVADGLDDAHFALLLPDVPGLYAVEISKNGQLLARKFAGAVLPQQSAEVKRVEGGVELRWNAAAMPFASIANVSTEGHTTLALWLEGGRAFVSTEGLEEGGMFEVSLSDGVQSQRLLLPRN